MRCPAVTPKTILVCGRQQWTLANSGLNFVNQSQLFVWHHNLVTFFVLYRSSLSVLRKIIFLCIKQIDGKWKHLKTQFERFIKWHCITSIFLFITIFVFLIDPIGDEDTTSVKTTKKTKGKKKVEKKGKSKISIFDDDSPSIFDDPLNATSK